MEPRPHRRRGDVERRGGLFPESPSPSIIKKTMRFSSERPLSTASAVASSSVAMALASGVELTARAMLWPSSVSTLPHRARLRALCRTSWAAIPTRNPRAEGRPS